MKFMKNREKLNMETKHGVMAGGKCRLKRAVSIALMVAMILTTPGITQVPGWIADEVSASTVTRDKIYFLNGEKLSVKAAGVWLGLYKAKEAGDDTPSKDNPSEEWYNIDWTLQTRQFDNPGPGAYCIIAFDDNEYAYTKDGGWAYVYSVNFKVGDSSGKEKSNFVCGEGIYVNTDYGWTYNEDDGTKYLDVAPWVGMRKIVNGSVSGKTVTWYYVNAPRENGYSDLRGKNINILSVNNPSNVTSGDDYGEYGPGTYRLYFYENSSPSAPTIATKDITITGHSYSSSVSGGYTVYTCYCGDTYQTAHTYSVKYNANGGSGSMSNSSHIYDTAKNLSANTFTRTGYTFAGWATSANGNVAYSNGASVKNLTTANGGTVDLYAKWNPITYSVKYNANGGSGSMSNSSHTYDTAKNLTANAFTRTGYTFAGWATAANGNVAYSNGASVKNLTTTNGGTVDLYAQWKPITYNVKYNANGGSGSMSNSSYTYDTAKNLTANAFTRTGYIFAGWATAANGSVTYSNGASVNNLTAANGGTVDLYAKWTPITYSVKYNANGGSGSMSNSSHTYDTASNLTANAFSKTGYTFGGWSTTAGGSKAYDDKASVNNLTSENGGIFNLHAVWTPNKYYINFDGNGSTSGTMTPQEFTYDVSGNLAKNTFEKSGYRFAGWNTKQDGSGDSYEDEASVKNLVENGSVTLYAQWETTAITLTVNVSMDSDAVIRPAHGTPVAIFRLEDKKNGRFYYRAAEFKLSVLDSVAVFLGEDTLLETVTFDGLEPGSYALTQVDTYRYEALSGTPVNEIDLTADHTIDVVNTVATDQWFGHNDLATFSVN